MKPRKHTTPLRTGGPACAPGTTSSPAGRWMVVCCWLILLEGCAAFAQAESAASTFENANKLYAQGKIAEAIDGYRQVLQSGLSSPAIYFNLGNAFFKAGQIGKAIAAYRQAEEVTPRDPDIQANLKFARNCVQGPTVPAAVWQRWLNKLSLDEWTVLAAASLWVWLLLLAAVQWRPALKLVWRNYLVGLGLAAALLCACFAADFYLGHSPPAIVAVPEAVVRQTPFPESEPVFTAHDGAELRVLDRKDDWLQVSAGRTGWLRRNQVILATHFH